jgi:hypothetical protein
MVCSDVPNAKLPVATVSVCPAVNREARILRLQWKAGKKS